MRAVLAAVMALAPAPHGFTVGELARKVHEIGERDLSDYSVRRAAYDLKKLRGKEMVSNVGRSRRYRVLPQGLRVIAGLVLLRDKVLKPLLAAMANPLAGNPARPKQGRTKECAGK
ncbi:MAG: hypothetical protein HY669_04630 [Chloroflexi bacterium]|nr:hypothetical protein [Chloroflexota bacterium]